MYKIILKFFIPYFLLLCVNTFFFTKYVFSLDIDLSQRIAFSVLISIPLCIVYILFLLYFHCLCLYALINLILVPSIKLWKKLFELSDEKNILGITDLKIIINYHGWNEELKKIYFCNLFQHSCHYDKLRENIKNNNFLNIYFNLIADKEELSNIINNASVRKILLQWDRKKTRKILNDEEIYIDLFMYFCWHKTITNELRNFNYGVKMIEYPVHKKYWLEKFEDFLIEKKIYWFPQSDFVKQIKENKKKEERNYYRSFIRCGDIKKILLSLRDAEIKKNNKKYENDDFYYC